MNLALILTRFFTSGGMSLVQMVSVPPSFFLDAANAHLYRYSHFKTSRSIFTTRQFQKTNFMPHLGHSTISIKFRCHSYIPANKFTFKIRKPLFGALLVQFFLFGQTNYLIMFLLLTEILFAHDVFSVQHLMNIRLLLPLHLHMHLIILLPLLSDALPVFILMLVLHRFTPLFHPLFLRHGTLRTYQLRAKRY